MLSIDMPEVTMFTPNVCLATCAVRFSLIPDAPHGDDGFAAGPQMAAQHLDVGVYGAILAVIVIVPDLLQDFLAAQGNALVADQKHQQIKLLAKKYEICKRK